MFDLFTFLPRAVVQGIPLLLGSTGETLTEKSGNLNLGIPGIMYVGAISGVIGSFFYEQSTAAGGFRPLPAILIPVLCCLVGSLLMGLLYCFLTVTLRANQNVTGLALTTFGVGFGNFIGGSLIKLSGSELPSIILTATSNAFRTSFPFAEKLGARPGRQDLPLLRVPGLCGRDHRARLLPRAQPHAHGPAPARRGRESHHRRRRGHRRRAL